VSVDGRTRPYLIPEAYYWETYFRFKMLAAKDYKLGPASFADEFISAQKQFHLPIPAAQIVTLLTIAEATITQADQHRVSRATSGTGSNLSRKIAIEVADIVEGGRAALIRQLPKVSWIAVQRDADRTRFGTVFDFPSF
jgi:hypothetical protein